eukprot:scaffold474198_cov46-Prasinocladus_malaysianus.AAC.1
MDRQWPIFLPARYPDPRRHDLGIIFWYDNWRDGVEGQTAPHALAAELPQRVHLLGLHLLAFQLDILYVGQTPQ